MDDESSLKALGGEQIGPKGAEEELRIINAFSRGVQKLRTTGEAGDCRKALEAAREKGLDLVPAFETVLSKLSALMIAGSLDARERREAARIFGKTYRGELGRAINQIKSRKNFLALKIAQARPKRAKRRPAQRRVRRVG